MLKYVVEVKCSNHSTARLGGWCFPGRIWVRGYGESKKPVYEKTIGFVDKRYQGEKSRYHRVYRAATRWAMYMELIQNAEIECPLDDFGRMLIEKYDIETLTKKVRYTQWEETDLEDWEIDKCHWDKQVVYALVVKTRLQLQSQTTH